MPASGPSRLITGTAQRGRGADGLGIGHYGREWPRECRRLPGSGSRTTGRRTPHIAGATEAEYTLTSAEEGKTIKVRVTFTDDGGTEETLISEATAVVTAALPSVSVEAVSSPVTEGTAASFRLSRTGGTAAALTVAVSVTEEGAVVSGTAVSSVTFASGERGGDPERLDGERQRGRGRCAGECRGDRRLRLPGGQRRTLRRG